MSVEQKQARKLGRCDSSLQNLKTLPTDWLTHWPTDLSHLKITKAKMSKHDKQFCNIWRNCLLNGGIWLGKQWRIVGQNSTKISCMWSKDYKYDICIEPCSQRFEYFWFSKNVMVVTSMTSFDIGMNLFSSMWCGGRALKKFKGGKFKL